MSRVLVTGGFGFLGSHVVERLLAEGATEVHVVDNLSSNAVPVERLLDELGRPDQLTYDACSLEEYLTGSPAEFQEILHLASVVGPAGVLSHGGRIVETTVRDIYLLADYALEHGARLLDVSTSEVYGGGRDGLCAEEDPKIVPAETTFRLEYAIAKLAAETALINMQQRFGLDVVIVRPFNIAGPRQSGEGGFVLPRFLAQARLGLPLTIFGTGAARRAFSHVADMADGVLLALRGGEPGVAYNLGNPDNKITVEELADLVLEVTGAPTEKQFVDPVEVYGPGFAEANDKFPASGRAMSDLGWEPSLGVETIVRDTWKYMCAAPPDLFAALAGRDVIERVIERAAAPSG